MVSVYITLQRIPKMFPKLSIAFFPPSEMYENYTNKFGNKLHWIEFLLGEKSID